MQSQHNYNKDMCDVLLELGHYERDVNRNIHKYNAYRKAASSLSSYNRRIRNGEEAMKLPGIGNRIGKKIDEFLECGSVQKLQNIRESHNVNVIRELSRISGIGPAAANKFYDDGIRTIEDLKRHTETLNHHQRIGLKYLEQFEERIPRNEIEDTEKEMNAIACKLSTNLMLIICGSFRRGASQCGDIDALLTHTNVKSKHNLKKNYLKDFVEKLENAKLITDRISIGMTKFMGVCQLRSDLPHRRIDIRFLPYDQFYCGILYFTGSDVFNQRMRKHANDNGFTLNEYCLRRIGSTGVAGEPLRITAEKDIFEYIDFPYKRPEDRN